MSELVKFLVYALLLFTPCIVAARCASDRSWRRRKAVSYDGIERRDNR